MPPLFLTLNGKAQVSGQRPVLAAYRCGKANRVMPRRVIGGVTRNIASRSFRHAVHLPGIIGTARCRKGNRAWSTAGLVYDCGCPAGYTQGFALIRNRKGNDRRSMSTRT